MTINTETKFGELMFRAIESAFKKEVEASWEEHKKKLSESLKNKEPWNKGKQLSESHREKIANKKIDDDYRKKRSNVYLFTSPEGIEHEIIGLNEFCKENNFSSVMQQCLDYVSSIIFS